jgi:hypothetical protein
VICFQCGKGLRDWGINDRPWEEHATWFPDCPLVLAVHGKDYATAMKQRQVGVSGIYFFIFITILYHLYKKLIYCRLLCNDIMYSIVTDNAKGHHHHQFRQVS